MDRFLQLFGDSPRDYVVNSALMAFIAYLIWRMLLKPLIKIIKNVWLIFSKQDIAALEIIPPKQSAAHPLSTQDLFAVLQQSPQDFPVSLEISSSKTEGIRYRVIALRSLLPNIQKHFASYMPELKFEQTEAPTLLPESPSVFTVKQSRHFAYPLRPHEDLQKSDPIAYIAGSMTQMLDGEELTMQIVTRGYNSREASRIYNKLLNRGRVLIDGKIRYYLLAYSWVWVPAVLIGMWTQQWQLGFVTALVLWVPYIFSERTERELTHLEERMFEGIANKLEQPLLYADIRMGIYSPNRTGKLVNGLISSFETLNTDGFQRLRLSRQLSFKWARFYNEMLFRRRLGAVLTQNSSVFSLSELASIFHFPNGLIKTDSMIHTHSRTLPAPISLKSDKELDVIFGVNKHHGVETPIGLTESERERHMFVVGGTGSGKTTLLKYQIIQDIQNGKGVAIIDPHGDLAEELLEYIPEERKQDLIYLNPDDLDHPIGVNLLELPEGLTGNDLLREKDRITESVVSVMRKIFSEDDSGGHRIEYVLRNAVQTALTMEKPTIFTIFRLLNDGKFAKEAIKNLDNEDLKLFWKNELGKAGTMQKVKMAAGITAKIGRFLFSASARAMLEKEKSDIDFSDILNGKIFICNFSKGRLGEDTSMLFGITVLAKLQLAALKRSELKQADRKPFYLYVDEFQNFATLSFTQMLSESRKYKVFLTMAEQSTQQQDDQKMVNIILANVGTVVVFRTGSPKDEELLLPLFEPYIEKGEISNLSAYNFYCRITSVNAQEPMSGETLLIND